MNEVENENQSAQQLQAEQQLDAMLNRLLETGAKERLGNIRLANPQLYATTRKTILTLYQNGALTEKLTEEQLKIVLEKINAKREPVIRRK